MSGSIYPCNEVPFVKKDECEQHIFTPNWGPSSTTLACRPCRLRADADGQQQCRVVTCADRRTLEDCEDHRLSDECAWDPNPDPEGKKGYEREEPGCYADQNALKKNVDFSAGFWEANPTSPCTKIYQELETLLPKVREAVWTHYQNDEAPTVAERRVAEDVCAEVRGFNEQFRATDCAFPCAQNRMVQVSPLDAVWFNMCHRKRGPTDDMHKRENPEEAAAMSARLDIDDGPGSEHDALTKNRTGGAVGAKEMALTKARSPEKGALLEEEENFRSPPEAASRVSLQLGAAATSWRSRARPRLRRLAAAP